MSQSRRFSRIGIAVAAGLIALVGIAPSGAAVISSGSTSHSTPAVPRNPGDWCC